MKKREKWRLALIKKLATGDHRSLATCDRNRRLIDDGIAFLRSGARREGGEFYFVVIAFSEPNNAWSYRLCYGGSVDNVLARWVEQ